MKVSLVNIAFNNFVVPLIIQDITANVTTLKHNVILLCK